MSKINVFLLAANLGTFALFTGPAWKHFNPPAGPFQTIQKQARGIYSQLDAFNTHVMTATGRY